MKYNLILKNIKCWGCANTITRTLESFGTSNICVNPMTGEVFFETRENMAKIKSRLSELGYPEASSEEAKSLFKKARSYASCAIGKMGK